MSDWTYLYICNLEYFLKHSKLLLQRLPSKLSDPHRSVADPQQLSSVQPRWNVNESIVKRTGRSICHTMLLVAPSQRHFSYGELRNVLPCLPLLGPAYL